MQANAVRPSSTWRIMQYMHHKCQLKWPVTQHGKNNCKNGIKNDRESKSSGDVHDKWDLIADRDFKMRWEQSLLTKEKRKPFIDI